MKCRLEGGVTYTQTFDFENRLTAVQTITGTTTFVYDGDGRQIAAIAPDGKVSRAFYNGLPRVCSVNLVHQMVGGERVR